MANGVNPILQICPQDRCQTQGHSGVCWWSSEPGRTGHDPLFRVSGEHRFCHRPRLGDAHEFAARKNSYPKFAAAMKNHFFHIIACLCTVLELGAADWPRFRGPNGAGISDEKELPLEWSATKNIIWKAELPGRGASSPIIWQDRIYVTAYSGYGLTKDDP